MKQMVQIGVTSIPLLFITSIFTGMVAAIQAKYQFRGFVPDKFVGTAAAKMIFIPITKPANAPMNLEYDARSGEFAKNGTTKFTKCVTPQKH